MNTIPEFPNEMGSNPVVAIDLRFRDDFILRFEMPDVQQSRVMLAMGQLLASLDVELNISLPESPPTARELLALLERAAPYIKTISRNDVPGYEENDPALYEEIQAAIAKASE